MSAHLCFLVFCTSFMAPSPTMEAKVEQRTVLHWHGHRTTGTPFFGTETAYYRTSLVSRAFVIRRRPGRPRVACPTHGRRCPRNPGLPCPTRGRRGLGDPGSSAPSFGRRGRRDLGGPRAMRGACCGYFHREIKATSRRPRGRSTWSTCKPRGIGSGPPPPVRAH